MFVWGGGGGGRRITYGGGGGTNGKDPKILSTENSDLFRLCPPVRYAPTPTHPPPPQIKHHVPLHSKSLSKNMARASFVAINMHPLTWGGAQTEKIHILISCKHIYWVTLKLTMKLGSSHSPAANTWVELKSV